MLETLVSVANFIRTSFYYVIYGSYKTGYHLVSFLHSTFQCLGTISTNGLFFLSALYESLIIFLQDNVQFLQQVLSFTTSGIDTMCCSIIKLFSCVWELVDATLNLIALTYTIIANGMTAAIIAMIQLLAFLKKLFVLFGLGVWFLITLAPLSIYYSCVLLQSLFDRLGHEILDLCYSVVSNLITLGKGAVLFVLDVPLESFAGILIALSFAYIFSQFYMFISTSITRKLRYLRNWTRRQWRTIANITIFSMFQNSQRQRTGQRITNENNQLIRGRRPLARVQQSPVLLPRPRTKPGNSLQKCQDSPKDNEKWCVICQERNKCILLLPCRHLCLCVECTRELRYYNELCPICRTNIASTMKIYI